MEQPEANNNRWGFLKGIVLLLLIATLVLVARTALRGEFSGALLRSNASLHAIERFEPTKDCDAPGLIYSRWMRAAGEGIAVGIVLDAVWGAGWRVKPSEPCDPEWQQSWGETFCYINNQLYAIAGDPEIDVKAQRVDDLVIPPGTAALGSFNGILPAPVQKWVLRERTRKTLADLVVLLIVIASLGSLIFLVVGFICPTTEIPWRDIIFRPVLGGLLAMGVFVANLGLLGISSTGGIFEIRPEGLYLLALGAGLYTDRVYEYLRKRVDAVTQARQEGPAHPEAEGEALHAVRPTAAAS